MDLKPLIYCLMLLYCSIIYGQTDNNILDTSTWTIGTGSVAGFSKYGATDENSRVYKDDHLGNEVIVWQASPNGGGGVSGGFTSPIVPIDNTKTYRLSVWIKKTNSNSGSTHLKPQSYSADQHHTTYLDGGTVTWHPFWRGDLPMLNRWYLLVGYIHESTYISTIDLGKIYDGVTGEAVVSMRDHKFKASATQLQHRTIIYGSSDTSDRQYMYAPRMELVDGTEWTLNQLLSINPDSKLLFAYDNAGNQKQRFYCAVADCSVPNPPAGRVAPEDVVASKETETEAIEEVKLEEDSSILKKDFTLYPNPTNGKVTIQLSGKDYNLTKSISIYSTNGSLVQKININNPTSQMELDISDKPTGVYFIHMHFSNGTVTTEQIIKE